LKEVVPIFPSPIDRSKSLIERIKGFTLIYLRKVRDFASGRGVMSILFPNKFIVPAYNEISFFEERPLGLLKNPQISRVAAFI